METMRAAVFLGKGQIKLQEVPRPEPGPGEALVKITLTTICGMDLHILQGDYPARAGLIVGHEPVGRIEAVGAGIRGYAKGDRVLVGAITPCGQCRACLSHDGAQCSHGQGTFEAVGGWRLGNTIHGCQAEYVVVPDAQGNLARIPDGLTDEDVVLCPDAMSAGIAAAENGDVGVGDAVAVFAQGPIGLCATAGARLCGASLVVAIESAPERAEMAKRMGADVVLDPRHDVVAAIKKLTGGGVDVAIEAHGHQPTFEKCLRSVHPGGVISSLGAYSGHVTMPLDAIAGGLGDHTIRTTLCPGGKERMRRLMSIVQARRFPFGEIVTHSFPLSRIEEAYDLLRHRQDGVIKIAIRP